MRRRLRAVAVASATAGIAVVAGVATAPPAVAHAAVVSTRPAAGSTVRGPVIRVAVTFEEPVTLVPHPLAVATDLGVPVALGPAQLGGGGDTLTASVQDRLATGRYSVAWRVRADDGHIESGAFTFALAGAGAGDPAAPTAGAAVMPPPAQPTWPVLVAAAIALLAGLGAGLVVRRGLRLAAAEPYPADETRADPRVRPSRLVR